MPTEKENVSKFGALNCKSLQLSVHQRNFQRDFPERMFRYEQLRQSLKNKKK